MNCQETICRLVSCPVTDGIPDYLGKFSLQNGLVFTNALISVANSSYPGGFYYQAPGTITITVPPGAGGSGGLGKPVTISYQGCKSTVSASVPSGASASQIQTIVSGLMQQVAAQAAGCNAPTSPNNPTSSPVFWNESFSASCPSGLQMKLVGNLPPSVDFATNAITIVSGVFSSIVSQADANSQASNFINSLIGSVIQCGYYNDSESFTCPNGTVQTVPEGSIFSQVSQADADQQAVNQANRQCGGLAGYMVWNVIQLDAGTGATANATPDGSETNAGFTDVTATISGQNANASIAGSFTNTCSHNISVSVAINATGNAGNCIISVSNDATAIYSVNNPNQNTSVAFTLAPGAVAGVGIATGVDGTGSHHISTNVVVTADLSC